MEFVNKLVVTSKNPTKNAKLLCKQIRRILSPNVTLKLKDKHPSIKRYKTVADDLKMSHFIVTGEKFIKIGKRPDGPTITFSIENYNNRITSYGTSIYNTDPLITVSGNLELSNFFKELSCPSEVPERNIHFHFDDDTIQMRHYKIVTQEDEDIKVMLAEIGPRLTLKVKKVEDTFF